MKLHIGWASIILFVLVWMVHCETREAVYRLDVIEGKIKP